MKVKSLLTAAGLLTFCWILFAVFRMVFEQRPNVNADYLPADTRFALRLDGRNFLEESLLSVLVEARDEHVVEQVRQLLTRPRKKGRGKSRNLGIDYFSDIIYFSAGSAESPYSGILVNLNNPRRFRKRIRDYQPDIAYAGTRGNVGIILFKGVRSASALKHIGKNMQAKGNTPFLRVADLNDPREKELLSIYTNPGTIHPSKKGASVMHLRSAGRSLRFNGTVSTGLNRPTGQRLKPADLHIYSALIPELIQDSIQQLARRNGVELPRLQSFSMNYRGLKLFLHRDKILFMPDMELLLTFEKAVDAENAIRESGLLAYFGITSENGIYHIGNERCYVSQPTAQSVYIGAVETPQLEAIGSLEFAMKGNPEILTKVDADMMISMVMNAYPPYQASKTFFEHAKLVNIEIRAKQEGPSELSGEITFDDGRYPFNELIRLVLDGQFTGLAVSAIP